MRNYPILACFLLAGCLGTPPVPTVVPSAVKVDAKSDEIGSKRTAAIEAADYANGFNPDGAPKTATSNALRAALYYSPKSTDADRVAFMKMVNLDLAGKFAEAKIGWDRARADADARAKELEDLRAKAKSEQDEAARAWQQKLDAAHQEARKARDRWIMGIFFGGGALLVIGGVVILVLGAQFSALYPALGPKAAFCALGAGLILISIGIAVNAIQDVLERHPYAVLGVAGGAAVLVSVAGGLIYANHHHATTK